MCRKVIISRNDDNNDAFLLIYLHQSLLLSRLVGLCQYQVNRLYGPSAIYLANIYSPRHGWTVTDQDSGWATRKKISIRNATPTTRRLSVVWVDQEAQVTAFNDSGHGRRKNPFVHEQVNVQRRGGWGEEEELVRWVQLCDKIRIKCFQGGKWMRKRNFKAKLNFHPKHPPLTY